MGEISDAFLDGIYEIFSTLYTKVDYYAFDPLAEKNIYGESKDKPYLDPVSLVAKLDRSPRGPGRVENVQQYDMLISIPHKSFILANIPTNTDDMNYIKKGVFKCYDKFYTPVSMLPYGGAFEGVEMRFQFECREVDERYLSIIQDETEGGG